MTITVLDTGFVRSLYETGGIDALNAYVSNYDRFILTEQIVDEILPSGRYADYSNDSIRLGLQNWINDSDHTGSIVEIELKLSDYELYYKGTN